MLLLTRKNHQTITIGTNIVVTVLEIEGGRIKVGIDAPQEYRIAREDYRRRDSNHDHAKSDQMTVVTPEPG